MGVPGCLLKPLFGWDVVGVSACEKVKNLCLICRLHLIETFAERPLSSLKPPPDDDDDDTVWFQDII